jgi:hypothetical protein
MSISELKRIFDGIAHGNKKISRTQFANELSRYDIVSRENGQNVAGKDKFLNLYELKNACLDMGFNFFNYATASAECGKLKKGKIDDIVNKIFTEAQVGQNDGLSFAQFKALPRFWRPHHSRKEIREDIRANERACLNPSVSMKNQSCYW